jgi:hypothetical protein
MITILSSLFSICFGAVSLQGVGNPASVVTVGDQSVNVYKPAKLLNYDGTTRDVAVMTGAVSHLV